ncbi:MAG TPA: GNAT family N-acetyltransferase, partial [Clostridia bacterium]|nr:GNAT family N-acetyltransferase [Clostridia bacterium]
WAYRNKGAKLRALCNGKDIVGLALTYEEDEEPACYYLMGLMVDRRFQGRGYGPEAVRLIVGEFLQNPRYPMIEVSVDRTNGRALRLFEKAGFTDSGYTDPALPQYVNLVMLLR